MYGALCQKPTTLWTSGFTWVPKARCGTKKEDGRTYFKCKHLKNKTNNQHPKKVENMGMEEKVLLPKDLVTSLLEAMVQARCAMQLAPWQAVAVDLR